MKNLYPKGKGKIHPSPASPSASSSTAAASPDALAVLKLLPAAIVAMTAVLGFEDKEVLAYLITWSISGPAAMAEAAEDRRRCRRPGGFHRPLFDCGCFDCYTYFWSRWDCSPDRELIHQVIEEFEEHLAKSERKEGRGRRRERRAGDRAEKGKKSKEKEKKKVAEEKVTEAEPAIGRESFSGEDRETMQESEAEKREEEVGEVSGSVMEMAPPADGGERRRAWPDVMGLFNSRLWSLWSPGV